MNDEPSRPAGRLHPVSDNSELTTRNSLDPYAHVGDPGWLRAHNLFVAEGRLVVSRLIAARRFTIHSILLTPAARAALGEALPPDVPLHIVEPDVMSGITGFNFHRGCLALAFRPEATPPGAFMRARRLVALEGVGNPDNVGGIFRVGAAFGVEGVLLDPASGDPFYRKAIRTSMGAALHVPFARLSRWPVALEEFKAAGVQVVALTPREDALPLDELAPAERWMFLAGAEGAGLSDAALAAAHVRVRIPTSDAVDSLNVTVAVGIALSRLFRQA